MIFHDDSLSPSATQYYSGTLLGFCLRYAPMVVVVVDVGEGKVSR